MPGYQQVEAALGPVMDRGRAGGRLVEHLLGLRLGRCDSTLGLLLRLADGVVRLGARAGARLVCLRPRTGNGVLGLLLGRGEHPLGLLARLCLELVRLCLGVGAQLRDLVLGTGLLRPRLVVGQLEDLPHPLADLFVGGLDVLRLLAAGGQLKLQPFHLVERAGQPLLEVACLAAGAGDEFVHLTAAVATHLYFERVFGVEVRYEVSVLSHGVTREVGQAGNRRSLKRRGRVP